MKIIYKNYLNSFKRLIDDRQTFEIVGVPVNELKSVTDNLEKYIESIHLKCRIYTKNRIVIGGIAVLNLRWGIASIVGIAAHHILTWNPDYELSRDIANNRVNVLYKK